MTSSALAASDTWQGAYDIIEKRCVSCHACYSSPCQINLSSYDGILRGGKNDPIYDGERLLPQTPTRLYIDAKSEQEWRKVHDFYPVIGKKKEDEMLFQSIVLGSKRGTNYQEEKFQTKTGLICPEPSDWRSYAASNTVRGMPFGFPALNKKEASRIKDWALAGYPGKLINDKDIFMALPKGLKGEIQNLENYLNQPSLKDRIVSRYLYEHLFLAHIYFSKFPKHFFRVVRSRTASPYEVDEIATVRPFDDPKEKKFYYRLRPLHEVIVHKNHIIFEVTKKTIDRLKQTLNHGDWVSEPKKFPSYNDDVAANPFVTFVDMPLEGRYRFFLENARYFVMTFIRGPVCEGQVAVNVIRDHFFTLFVDPKYDLSVQDKNYLVAAAKHLTLPAAGKSSPFKSYYNRYKKQQMEYVKFRAERYKASKMKASSIESIWDGDRVDKDAALTIFRNFDNSSVIQGLWAGPAKTVWIMDYPIFERMYYLLAAGFNVFGNVFHQASTRMYMDNLRVESENNFIYLVPQKLRHGVRLSWYEGEDAQKKMAEENRLFSRYYQSTQKTDQTDPEAFVKTLQKKIIDTRLKRVVNNEDKFNCCWGKASKKDIITKETRRLTGSLANVARYMPEVTLILVTSPKKQSTQLIFLTKLTAHTNVSFLFEEDKRLKPQDDKLIATEDWVGSYPNLFIYLNEKKYSEFVSKLTKAPNKESVEAILSKYAITRDDANFWKVSDVLESFLREKFKVQYGRLDLSKYSNIRHR